MADVLQNKSYKNYDYISRYSNVPFYYNTADGKYMFGTVSNLSDTTPFVLYETQAGDTYDSISLSFYNIPTLYWVICDFNRIHDCLEEIPIGTILKIPSLGSLQYKG